VADCAGVSEVVDSYRGGGGEEEGEWEKVVEDGIGVLSRRLVRGA
jgi:hypothetical protein